MSIFQKIIDKEIPAYIIDENDHFMAFLDVFPVTEGHVLVIPKVAVDKFYDMDSALIGQWMQYAQRIALALEKAIPCKRVGMSIVGLEVPHAHIHLLPINKLNDMSFEKERLKFTNDEYEVIRDRIKKELS